MNIKKSKIHTMTQCSLFAALICVCSPFMIPFGPVPLSIGLFAVMLTAVMLSPSKAITSVCIYILIGICGLPVFSGFRGGFSVIAGPTGGYIWSYIIMCAFISFFCRRFRNVGIVCTVCIISLAICWLSGAVQYAVIAHTGINETLALCVYPFVVPDVIKAAAAAVLGTRLKEILSKQQL